ncbi:MAG: pyruvate ferredoxin oxidoreductase [Thermovirgaceae bacterium]|nr:pyruvate ferredoxin oxidoreductase [Thermovirgaceae bacterium]
MPRKDITSGNWAVAEAMRQINPDVVAAYPITPSTDIPMKFSEFVADGLVDTNLVTVESEHSAISACVAASVSGARVMTASSANGVALMHEIFPIAASYRTPIVFGLVNRSLGAPINIHCDHSDSMAERDSGWIHIYCEDGQEVYDTTIMAVRIAEQKEVLLPVFVCQDGFITSHCFEPIEFMDDEAVREFIGERDPLFPLLDVDNPVAYGSLALTDYYFEIKRQQVEAMKHVEKTYMDVAAEFAKITGRNYPLIDKYLTEDADYIMVIISSAAGAAKETVDRLREQGHKVGCLRIRLFRPFPANAVVDALKGAKAIAVCDRATSLGASAPLFTEIKGALYDAGMLIPANTYVYGLGGRDFFPHNAEEAFMDLINNNMSPEERYLGLRE